MNCSSNPKFRTMPAPDKKRRELIGAQGNRPTAPKPHILLGQVMNPSCTDGFYENAMVRTAGYLEGTPLMTVRKIGIDDLKEFSGDIYGDINYKKALPKPEPTPRTSKVRKGKSEEFVDAKEERNSCEAKALKPLPYYTDIDESQIRKCISPIFQTLPLTTTDELSELIYEAPSHFIQPHSHLTQPHSHLTQPPVSPVKRCVSLNTDRRGTNRNPPDTYYQVEDPYLQPKSKINFKPADQNYQIKDAYLHPQTKISLKSAEPYFQFEDAYLQIEQDLFKKTPAKPKWRLLGRLGKKSQKIKGSSSEQNLPTK